MYPRLRIIVVDDSRRPTDAEGVETVVLPYDSGVSAGRREGLRRVSTKYVINLDDDYIFYRQTDLASALSIMESYPEIDIMGGEVIYLPFFKRIDYSKTTLYPTDAAPTLRPGSSIGGLPVYDKVANFFIAPRTGYASSTGILS